jgi:hypothetical protein
MGVHLDVSLFRVKSEGTISEQITSLPTGHSTIPSSVGKSDEKILRVGFGHFPYCCEGEKIYEPLYIAVEHSTSIEAGDSGSLCYSNGVLHSFVKSKIDRGINGYFLHL